MHPLRLSLFALSIATLSLLADAQSSAPIISLPVTHHSRSDRGVWSQLKKRDVLAGLENLRPPDVWTVNVSVGTPPQEFSVNIDTGMSRCVCVLVSEYLYATPGLM